MLLERTVEEEAAAPFVWLLIEEVTGTGEADVPWLREL